MPPLFRAAPFALLTLLVLGTPAASAGKVEDAVDYRQGAMNIFSWNLGHMGAMVKGDVPFDATAFQGYAKDLAAATKLNVLDGFPEASVTDESDAKGQIWLNWADFESKLQDLRTQSAKLVDVAAGGDEAAIKTQLGETRKTCKACHDDYKE